MSERLCSMAPSYMAMSVTTVLLGAAVPPVLLVRSTISKFLVL